MTYLFYGHFIKKISVEIPPGHLESDEYRLECEFTLSKYPNLRQIIKKELVNSNKKMVIRADKWNKYEKYKNVVFSDKIWAELPDELTSLIRKYTKSLIAGTSANRQGNLIKRMYKELAKEEEIIISSFKNQSNHVIINDTKSHASAFEIFLLTRSFWSEGVTKLRYF